MVQINGDQSSLVPPPSKPAAAPRPKPTPKEFVCSACDGVTLRKKEIHDETCKHCLTFFGGIGFLEMGCTNSTPAEALRKSQEALQHDWVMTLRKITVGNGGAIITLQLGDILKVARAGTVPQSTGVSADRTRQMFMIEVVVGNVAIWLYPHEYAAVPFLTVMELKSLGQVEESFVGQNDTVGYFSPTAEMREEILEIFGDR